MRVNQHVLSSRFSTLIGKPQLTDWLPALRLCVQWIKNSMAFGGDGAIAAVFSDENNEKSKSKHIW